MGRMGGWIGGWIKAEGGKGVARLGDGELEMEATLINRVLVPRFWMCFGNTGRLLSRDRKMESYGELEYCNLGGRLLAGPVFVSSLLRYSSLLLNGCIGISASNYVSCRN